MFLLGILAISFVQRGQSRILEKIVGFGAHKIMLLPLKPHLVCLLGSPVSLL